MVSWWSGFVIPLIEIIFILAIAGAISIIIIRAIIIKYRQSWKWFFKYSIFGKSLSQKDVEWIVKWIDNGKNYWDIKKSLLIHGVSNNRINEVMYLTLKINKQKGGLKNGRGQFKRSISENKSSEFPAN